MRVVAISQLARLRIGVRLDYSSLMDQSSRRRLMPRPKRGCALPATTAAAAAAAPAAFDFVYPQVVRREQMALAANVGHGGALTNAIAGKAHHLSFGCFKARPRYHMSLGRPRARLRSDSSGP